MDVKRLTIGAVTAALLLAACTSAPPGDSPSNTKKTKGTDPIKNESSKKENHMDAIDIKNSDYRYDSFDNGKVLPFMEGTKKGLPAMGWNSWNAFGSANTEELTKIMADKFLELGLDKLGYKYIILDDGCYKPARVDGKLSNEPVKFPSGFKALSDYVHSKGLKFGMYNDIGTNLCAGAAVGTCGHEDVDAASYMEWGVDFLKVDNCYYLWDNATFSDAKNARYVYAPNIKGIRIEGKGLKNSLEFSAVKKGKITGRGARTENDYVTNIGTFDGTGPENTPVGLQSGELQFEVEVPAAGEYKLYVEYATSQEPGQGEWLQVAVSGQENLFFDGFLPATEAKNAFGLSRDISITLKEGKNVIRLMNHRRQENTLASYAKLLEEINKIKPDNDLVFSTCEWGKTQPQNWAYKVANSWRILNDITFAVGTPGNPGKGNWVDGYTPSVTSQYNKAVIMDEFAGLDKGWNDPDMMMIGMDGLTPEMNRTHFAMWCMMNSPLMLGIDLRRVQKGDWMYNIITNEKLIALNQDPLGVQAKRIKALYKKGTGLVKVDNPSTGYSRNNDRLDILAKPLYDGSIAVSFINLSQKETYENLKVSMKEIMDAIGHKMPVRPDYVNAQKLIVENLWTGEKTEINWTNDDAATGIRLSSGSLAPCDNLTLLIRPAEIMERRHLAASVHNYLLNTLGEKDEDNWDSAKELKDLYDCHACVMHIAQIYVKGIMDASEEDGDLFGTRTPITEEDIRETVERVLNPSKRQKKF
ncbi:MAG: alpha-galactosidase [Treponema sp.]|nr:alpha-galactosidase [Treponema sp.]